MKFLALLMLLFSGAGSCDVKAHKHSVSLTWNRSTSPVVSYNVYRSGVSGNYGSAYASTTSTSYKDTGVVSKQRYFYVVTAKDNVGVESLKSSEVAVTIP